MTATWPETAPAHELESVHHAESASALFERHRGRVLAFCRGRTRNAADAEDATQTTFMYALSALQRGVVPEFEVAWLLRIAENVCHSMRRRAHRRYERDELPADLLDDRDRDPAVISDRLSTIADALEALPETQRRAIVLREWRGLSYEDIATQLDTSHAAVETLLFRARRSLAKRVASIGTPVLHLPYLSRLARWLLGSGAGKATAVTAATITLGAGLTSDVPANRVEAPGHSDQQAAARYDRGPGAAAAPRSAGLPVPERRRTQPLRSAPRTTSRSTPTDAPADDIAATVGVDSPGPTASAAEPLTPAPATESLSPAVYVNVKIPPIPPLEAPPEVGVTVEVDVPATVTTVVEQLVPPAVTEVVTKKVPEVVAEVSEVVPVVELQVPSPLTLPLSVPPAPPLVPQLPLRLP